MTPGVVLFSFDSKRTTRMLISQRSIEQIENANWRDTAAALTKSRVKLTRD